jgi:hypothetical protein
MLALDVKSLCKLGSESSDQNQLNHPVKHLGMINFFGHHIIPLSAPKSFASYTALGAIFSQQYKPKHMKMYKVFYIDNQGYKTHGLIDFDH